MYLTPALGDLGLKTYKMVGFCNFLYPNQGISHLLPRFKPDTDISENLTRTGLLDDQVISPSGGFYDEQI